MKLLILFLMSFYAYSSTPKVLFYFYVHGGAMESYISDKVIISDDRTVNFETVSPTFADYPNTIGRFQTTLSEDELSRFRSVIQLNKKSLKTPSRQPLSGSLVEELHIGSDKTFWTSQEDSAPAKAIRAEFLMLAKKTYETPLNALSLHCSQSGHQILCAYKNAGKEEVMTIDPLGVSYSISCLDVQGKKEILHELEEFNPKKMTPEKIKIKPGSEYKFSIKTEDTCDYRIVVKTTDMMINKNYKDVLLGELVSNQLNK